MKFTTKNQAGIAHLMGIFAVVLVAVVGFAGYRVMQNQKSTTNDTAGSSAVSKAASIPITITSTSTLDQATAATNALQVDSDLNPAQLDSDINQLQ